MPNKKIINFNRIVILPLIVTIFLITLFASVTFAITTTTLRKQLAQEGTDISSLLSRKITNETIHYNEIIGMLEDNLVNTGKNVIANRNNLSNEFLAQMLEIFEVNNLYWYNPQGEIIYDAKNEYVGWTVTPGDPIHQFMISGDEIFVEEVRKSLSTDNYFKFAYVRADDGYFVQIGYKYEILVEKTVEYTYQSIIEKVVAEESNILYALVTDINLVAIADTDVEDIGIDYHDDPDYQKVLQGEVVVADWFYPKINNKVLEVAVPLKYDDEIIGIVAIGLSLKPINNTKNILLFSFTILLIGVVFFYLFFHIQFVFLPNRKLIKTIDAIDETSSKFSYIDINDKYFPGVYQTINHLFSRLNRTIERNKLLFAKTEMFANTDYLTKLPNRFSFLKNLEQLITKYKNIAVVMLDLDGFKEYNDTKGHLFGDELLSKVAEKFQQLNTEKVFVSRFGGDEFLFSYIYNDEEELQNEIEKLMNTFNEIFYVGNNECVIKACGGISLFPENADNIQELLRKADIAMYFSKRLGKNHYSFFKNSMEIEINEKSGIRKALQNAIDNDGFKLLYQPIINLKTQEITSFEALLRIKDSNLKPMEFIPIAEETGLIVGIGKIVIQKAIFQLAKWKQEGFHLKPIYVNVSPIQVSKTGLVQFIKEELEKVDIPPQYFGVEITENSIMENSEMIINFLEELNKIGVNTSLDDFGSGQASLHFLTKFHVQSIKLDKKLIDRFLKDSDIQILKQIIGLADMLGFSTLAEGIETVDQVKLLQTTNSDYCQGFYFYKPMEADEIKLIYDKKVKI